MEERIKTISGATAVLDVFIVQGEKKEGQQARLKRKDEWQPLQAS